MAEKLSPIPKRKVNSEEEIMLDETIGNISMEHEGYEDFIPNSSGCNSPLLQRNSRRKSNCNNKKACNNQGKKGFLNIFKWFRKRKGSKDSSDNSSNVVSESVSSLNVSLSDDVFQPLSRSKSSENPNLLRIEYRDKDRMRSSSTAGRTCNGTLERTDSFSSQKKRNAPCPPNIQSENVVMREKKSVRETEKRHTPLDPTNPFYDDNRNSFLDISNPFNSDKRNSQKLNNGNERRNSATNSEIYARAKRKAPQPPSNNWTHKNKQVSQSKSGSELSIASRSARIDSNDISRSSTMRSNSTVSNSTLQGSISSKCSEEYLKFEKSYLRPDLTSSCSTISKTESCSGSPNPKQWYKRKKKSKSKRKSCKIESNEDVYEFWRPEIQFNDGKIISSPEIRATNIRKPDTTKSLREKVIDVCKPKRKSQISLLANISQLDEEVNERIQVKKEEAEIQKKLNDDKFFKISNPIILTQDDISPKIECHSPKMLREKTDKSHTEYDNLEILTSTTREMPRHHDYSRENMYSNTVSSSSKSSNLGSWPIQNFLKEKSVNKSNGLTVTSHGDQSIKTKSKCLDQMANMDAEMFYKLAKNIQSTSVGDQKTIVQETKKTITTEKKDKKIRLAINESKKQKNFGLRMNQLFTPDVSVILEGSESIATTPADDRFNDLNSCLGEDNISHDQLYEELNLRIGKLKQSEMKTKNKAVAREIMQELEEVRQEIDRINQEETNDLMKKEINKAEQIRDEIVKLREKDHFSVWQNLVSGSSVPTNNQNGIPTPIEIASEPESKWKWICSVCTLINLPWKITCEACSTRRPNKPTRIKDDGTRISPIKEISEQCEYISPNISSPVIQEPVIRTERPRKKHLPLNKNGRTDWEHELKRYFEMENENQNNNTANTSHILYNNVSNLNHTNTGARIPSSLEKKCMGTKFLESNGVVKVDPDINEMRKARIERFEQGIKTFEALIRGTPEANSTVPNFERCSKLPSSPVLSIVPQFENNENVFYKKQARKIPVLNTPGAVKNRISIFNQKEQIDQASQKVDVSTNKNKLRNAGAIKENAYLFENMLAENFKQSSNNKEIPRPQLIEKNGDCEILSAISKFDELAAAAEIERINPKIKKNSFIRKPKRLIISTPDNFSKSQVQMTKTKPKRTLSTFSPNLNIAAECEKDYPSEDVKYVNRHSICSNSFEPINTLEFEEFEAERSQMGSPHPPSVYEDAFEDTYEQYCDKDDATINLEGAESFTVNKDHAIDSQVKHDANEYEDDIHNEKFNNSNSELSIPLENNFDRLSRVEKLTEELTLEKGIDEFKASFEAESSFLSRSSTVSITRLLKKLEAAIGRGDHDRAAVIAKDLATLRVNCNFTRSKDEDKKDSNSGRQHPVQDYKYSPKNIDQGIMVSETEQKFVKTIESVSNLDGSTSSHLPIQNDQSVKKRADKVISRRREIHSDNVNGLLQPTEPGTDSPSLLHDFNVQMYVEDRSSHQGPIDVTVNASMTVGELKTKVHEEFGFPSEFQRWILGRRLAENESLTLEQLRVTTEGCPVFLYLVAPTHNIQANDKKHGNLMKQRSHENKKALEYQEKVKSAKSNSSKQQQQLVSPNLLMSSIGSQHKSHSIENPLPVEDPVEGNELIRKEEMILSTNISNKNDVKMLNSATQDLNVNKTKSAKGTHKNKISQSPRNLQNLEITIEKSPMPKPTPLIIPNTTHFIDIASDNETEEISTLPRVVNGWICPRCTLVNLEERPGCEACATEKPESHQDNVQSKKDLLHIAQRINEAEGVVKTREAFECRICFNEVLPGSGVILRDCLHMFCRECLALAITFSETAAVKCPYRDDSYSCDAHLQEREIKALVTEENYEKHLNKSVKQAANSMQNVFHCKTPDCKGFCVFEDNVNTFLCYVCYKQNCLTCQAQHVDQSCKEYQEMVSSNQDINSLKTQKFFEEMIRRGDGMPCPHCTVMLVRKWGCDWMRCPMCRTEICWVTRGPRWGPKGQGDTSGGCKCGVNGRKCHPKCTFCH